jgi:hypothetical protein
MLMEPGSVVQIKSEKFRELLDDVYRRGFKDGSQVVKDDPFGDMFSGVFGGK